MRFRQVVTRDVTGAESVCTRVVPTLQKGRGMGDAQKAADRVELMRWIVARYDGLKERVERQRKASLRDDLRDAGGKIWADTKACYARLLAEFETDLGRCARLDSLATLRRKWDVDFEPGYPAPPVSVGEDALIARQVGLARRLVVGVRDGSWRPTDLFELARSTQDSTRRNPRDVWRALHSRSVQQALRVEKKPARAARIAVADLLIKDESTIARAIARARKAGL
jgi:hypothetical protein